MTTRRVSGSELIIIISLTFTLTEILTWAALSSGSGIVDSNKL